MMKADWQGGLRPQLAGQGVVVLLLALAIRLVGGGSPPVLHDELYTILAARSYAADGTFQIWQGEYARAPGFTALTGWFMAAFGDSLLSARLPSIFAGALLVAAGFLWLHGIAGATAAWSFAALLALSGFALHVSQFARFYALHGLLFWLGAIAVYAFLSRPLRLASCAILALGVAALAAAYHLQTATLIGLVGLALWILLEGVRRPDVRRLFGRASLWVVAAGALGALWLFSDLPGWLAAAYADFRWVALWNAALVDYRRFYVHQFAGNLPLLFYLFPFALLLALARAPRPTLFCLTVAGSALLLHSFAGMKAQRYVYYTYPFLFAIWGIAAASLRPLFEPVLPSSRRAAAALVVSFCALIALLGNPDYQGLRRLPATIAAELSGQGPSAVALRSQRETQEALRKLIDPGELLITSNELQTIYFLGRYDLLLGASRLDEFAPGKEFGRDPRTGGPVISTPASLSKVLACYGQGSVLVWGNDWRISHAVSPEVSDLIEAETKEVKLPGSLKVRAFRWQHEPTGGPDCARVRKALGASGA